MMCYMYVYMCMRVCITYTSPMVVLLALSYLAAT
jgi:hypothetical protein